MGIEPKDVLVHVCVCVCVCEEVGGHKQLRRGSQRHQVAAFWQ